MTLPRSVGRWEVVRELGRGGMGRVLEVRDPDAADRLLALKLLDARAAGPEGALRFQREAELMARVRHAHVVRIHEVGQADGAPFFVCEKVEGRPLDALLALDGPLAPVAAARLARALADGLVACHAQGIVHRDLKPANVIVRPDGSPVLLDFGVARDEQARSLTETGAVVGTPAFMAPEQAEGRRADARTDVYGLGATLFCCLAARPPFEQGGGLQAALKRVLLDEPAWPAAPAGLGAVLRRAMAKRPDDRHPDMAALRDDLDGWFAAKEGRGPAPYRVGLAALLLVSAAALVAFAAASPEAEPPAPPPAPRVAPAPRAAPAPPVVRPDSPAARATALVERLRAERAGRRSRGRRVAALQPPGASARGTAIRAVLLAGGEVAAGLHDGRLVAWPGLADPGREVAWPVGVASASVTAIASFGRSSALVGTRSGAVLALDARAGVAEPLALPDGPDGSVVETLAVDPTRGLLALSRWSGREGIGNAQASAVHLWAREPAGRWRSAARMQLEAPAQGLALTPATPEVAIAFGTDETRSRGVAWLSVDGEARTWLLPRGYPRAVAWLPDGRLAVGTTVGQVQLVPAGAQGFDAEAERLLPMDDDMASRSHLEGVLLVAVVGARLVSSSWARSPEGDPSGDVKVWDTGSRALRLALPPEVTGARQLSLSEDGELLLVSGERGLLEVWDLAGL